METVFDLEQELTSTNHYFSIGRYDEAERRIHIILEKEPNNAVALYLKASILLETEKYSEARSIYEQALVSGYDEGDCLHLIGITYQYDENFKEAEKAFLQSLHIYPESADIHASYGYLMLWAGMNEKGLALLEEALKLDPTNARVNNIMLHYYLSSSDKKKQQVHIQSSMEHSDSESTKLFNLALFHIMKEEDKKAREYLRQAFLLNPTDKDLLDMLQEYDRRTHPLFLPQRLFQKMGGAAFAWIFFIVLSSILRFFKQDTISLVFIIFYFALAGFTWLAPLLYKWFVKGRV